MTTPLHDGGAASHPYYPLDLTLSGNVYLPNTLPVSALIQSFGGVVAALLLLTLFIARKVRPDLNLTDQALVLWFVMSKQTELSYNLHHLYSSVSPSSWTVRGNIHISKKQTDIP